MKNTISITKGSRIAYTVKGTDGAPCVHRGTVYAIGRKPYQRRTNGKMFYAIYLIAESPDEITREQVIDAVHPNQFKKDVLAVLLGQDVIDNLQKSKEAVAQANERPTFKPSAPRYESRRGFTTARV